LQSLRARRIISLPEKRPSGHPSKDAAAQPASKKCRLSVVASQPLQPAAALGADGAAEVQKGFSLNCPELCEAILLGYKDIENRSCYMSGWYAVHASRRKEPKKFAVAARRKIEATLQSAMKMEAFTRHLVPGLPDLSGYSYGSVVGLVFVERAAVLKQLREQSHCGGACQVEVGRPDMTLHAEACPLSPFASGPICNILSASIRLRTPIPCRGNVGCWSLPEAVRADIASQLRSVPPLPVLHFRSRAEDVLPRPWPLVWLPAQIPRAPEGFLCLPGRPSTEGQDGQPEEQCTSCGRGAASSTSAKPRARKRGSPGWFLGCAVVAII
jgi:hypothetical protein